jgi:formate hydrogenlyase subunit 3/multisubunit Na+/H+ antiporter MnhD subunit
MLAVYYLLIALIALPLLGTALALVAPRFPRLMEYEPIVHIGATALMLILAWVLRPAQVETIFGNWFPVSFTGAPLILSTNRAGMALLIALAAVMMVDPIARSKIALPARAASEALLFGALSLTVLSNNLVTVLVGLGAVDTLVILNGAVRGRPTNRLFRDALFLVGSLFFLIIAFSLYDASGNSLYFPLAHIPARVMPFILISLTLRFSLVPLRAVADDQMGAHWTSKASALAGMALMAHLPELGAPELRAWFFGLALLTALAVLVIGVLTNSRNTLRTSIDTGALLLALTSAVVWQSSSITVAAIAWLTGTTLLDQSTASYPTVLHKTVFWARLLGALCLIGLPLTAGFVGRAGVINTWAGRGLNGALLVVALTLAQLLLTLCALRLWRWLEAPGDDVAPSTEGYLLSAALGILCLHIVFFGIAPGLAAAPSLGDQITRNGLVGWVLWLLATLLGVAGWWFQPKWLDLLANTRQTLVSVVGLDWWQDILIGALGRIAKPLRGLFIFLESDGALLWAVVVILIIVLVSRPGGP